MVAVNLGITYSDRTAARTPTALLKNLVFEPDETNLVDQKSYITRPGAVAYPTPSTDLFRGSFQQDGLFSSELLQVNGNVLYHQQSDSTYTTIGVLAGTDLVTFTASADAVMINSGSVAYLYDGTTLTAITMPSAERIGWIVYLAGYFLLGVLNSQHIFFLVDGGSTAPDALDFFSAETNAGNVLRGFVMSDQLLLFGQKVVEFWQPSGDADLPFNRIIGQVYQKGIASKYAGANQDNSVFFVGDDLVVYRCAAIPTRVSTNAVEEKLRQNSGGTLVSWAFNMDGHSYFVMTIAGAMTLVFDVSTGSWLSWNSGTMPTWVGQFGIQIDGGHVVAGNPASSLLYSITGGATDDLGIAITREIVGGVPIVGPPQRCNNLMVIVDAGGGSSLTDDMIIDLRWSDDQGQTFSNWVPMDAGAAGQYSTQAVAKMLGQMRAPMRVFHMCCSTLGPFRISYARVNEFFASPFLFEVPQVETPIVAPVFYSISFVSPPDAGDIGVPLTFQGDVLPLSADVELAFSDSGTTPPTTGWSNANVSLGAWTGTATPQ